MTTRHVRRSKPNVPTSDGDSVAAVREPGDAVNTSAEPARATCDRLALYALDHVRAALGIHATGEWTQAPDLPRETEHQGRLADIIERGEGDRWRDLVTPPPEAGPAVEALVARAPHLGEVGRLVTMHLRGARTIGLPASLPPVLLVGGPGVGKSWFLSRLSSVLGLPFRRYSMSTSTLAEGLQGAHPSWRNAQPGLVAKTLLAERAANPVLFVDELDKAGSHAYNGDPHRAFYALLDPSDSRAFTDEYLGFPVDASKVLWVMAANDADLLPAPILDRLMVLHVPDPDAGHRVSIAASIYAEANEARRSFFDKDPGPAVVERLADMTPRAMRKGLDEAMARAAADGRSKLRADDVMAERSRPRKRFGFCG